MKASTFQAETELTPNSTLDESTIAKMVKSPKTKGAHAMTDIKSTCMAQMGLLDHKDPRRLKLKPERKADCCAHSWKHFSNLLKTPWKVNSSINKINHGGSYHTTNCMRHLKINWTQIGHDSVKVSLKDVELKENKHEKEATEIVENIMLRKETKLLLIRGKVAEQISCKKTTIVTILSRKNILVR